MSLIERALAAAAAERERTQAEQEMARTLERALAVDAIIRAGEAIGLDIRADDVVADRPGPKACYEYRYELTADATLTISYPKNRYSTEPELGMAIRPAEQLYWDLPPGQEEKEPGCGGTYGCYGLGSSFGEVKTLAEIGSAVEKIESARARWRKKHGVA